MSQNTFSMAGGVARNPLVRLAKPVTATIGADEHIAIVGPNGSGKSLFVDTLIGKYPLREGALQYDFSPSATQTVYDNVKYIAFRDTYGAADANYYYQQRITNYAVTPLTTLSLDNNPALTSAYRTAFPRNVAATILIRSNTINGYTHTLSA